MKVVTVKTNCHDDDDDDDDDEYAGKVSQAAALTDASEGECMPLIPPSGDPSLPLSSRHIYI